MPVNVQLRGHAGLPVDHVAGQGEGTTPKFSAANLLEVEGRGSTALEVVDFVTRAKRYHHWKTLTNLFDDSTFTSYF